MSVAHSENTPTMGRTEKWPNVCASLVVGAMFFALWFWLLPRWLGFRVETAGAARWRWLAAVPSVLGFAVALRCVWDFRLDGTRYTSAHCSTTAPCRSRLLSLRAQSDVCRFRCGLDRAVDRLWTSQLQIDRRCHGSCRWGCTSSSSCTKNQPCARNLEASTKSIAGT